MARRGVVPMVMLRRAALLWLVSCAPGSPSVPASPGHSALPRPEAATPIEAPPVEESPRSPPEEPPSSPAARLADAQRRLRAVREFDSAEIPQAARAPLRDLRKASIELVATQVEMLAAETGNLRAQSDKSIEGTIESSARAGGVDVAPPGESASQNGLWSPSVTRSTKNPRYLVIGFYFEVPCGTDGGYLFYDLDSNPPKLLLTLSSPDSDTIEAMFWNAAFALPPPGKAEDFFVVVTRLTPWCQSAGRRLQLLVLKPTTDAAAPQVLIDVTENQHLMKPFRVDVSKSSVVLETHDGIKKATRRWRIQAGAVVR